MRVVLHIGGEKTGTSTIQEYLFANKAKLRAQGVLSPDAALGHSNTANHFRIAVYGRREDRPDDLTHALSIRSVEAFRRDFRQALLAEVRAKPAKIVVFSSEHCAARLHFDDELERVRSLLAEIGEIRIVLYLRRQDSLWASHYSTRVKNNETGPFTVPPRALWNELFDYRVLCDRWARVFGKDALTVRVFSLPELASESLVDDFFAAAGIGVDRGDFVDPGRHNPALDWRCLEFLRRFNRYLPAYPVESGHKLDPRQGELIHFLEALSSDGRVDLPAADRQSLLNEFAERNAYVARTYLGREDGVLFPADPPAAAPRPPQHFDMDLAFEIFAKVWAMREADPNYVRVPQPQVPATAPARTGFRRFLRRQ